MKTIRVTQVLNPITERFVWVYEDSDQPGWYLGLAENERVYWVVHEERAMQYATQEEARQVFADNLGLFKGFKLLSENQLCLGFLAA